MRACCPRRCSGVPQALLYSTSDHTRDSRPHLPALHASVSSEGQEGSVLNTVSRQALISQYLSYDANYAGKASCGVWQSCFVA